MAEQDFNINIRTLADLTGIKLTQAQLEALQSASAAGNQKAAAALKQLADAQSQAQETSIAGLTGTAVGIGTIISLVTGAISKWRAFNDEQDRMVEGMIRAEEKARALGESILDMQDAARSAARIDTEPLEQSYIRLQQEIIKLKTEQSLLNIPEQGEEWKKINAEIRTNEALLDKVTRALERQGKEEEKLAREREKAAEKKEKDEQSFAEGAFKTSAPQVQRALQQEVAAKRAEAGGDWRSADLFRKSEEAFKSGMTGEQRAEFDQLSKVLDRLVMALERWQ